MLKRTVLKGLLALSMPLALLWGGAAQAEIREHQIKFAAQNSKGHPQVTGMEKFAELVGQYSGGKITVKLFPGGTLGGDLQTISALQGGILEMSVMNAGLLAGNVKAFAAVDLPFLFSTPEEADAVMDGPFGAHLAAKLPEKGLIGLGYWELGFRNLTNNKRPVASLDDIKGLKLRTLQAPIAIDMFTTLGANAVPLPYPELYTALETRTVDGQENPYANIITAKFYEVQKYLTITRHLYNPQIVLVGAGFWNKLNDEEKAVLQKAAAEARTFQRKASRDADAGFLAQIREKGMQVTELSPTEQQRIRDAVKPVIARFTNDIGAETIDLLNASLAKARGQ